MTHPDQTTERYDYDAEDQLIAYADAKGLVTRYRYNGHGLPVERTDPLGQKLEYRYDRALRLTELVNGNGESYRLSYDAESRLESETGFDGKKTTYIYDPAGQLIASECAGQRTEFKRDPLGLLVEKRNADGEVRYAYDALGRLTAVASPRAEQRYAYDPVGQLIEERTASLLGESDEDGPRSRAAFVLAHAYDPLGNRIQTTLPNGRRVDTQRYGSGHWHGTLWQGRSLVDLERDALHRETTRQFGQGRERLSATRAYDPQSRLIAFSLNRGLQRLHERRYAYDASGNLTAIDDGRRGHTAYAYDPLGQLLSAVQPTLSERFAFDPAGNLLDTEGGERARAADPEAGLDQPGPGTQPPRLARITHNLLRQYLGTHYEYDAQGNTVLKRQSAVSGANEASMLALAYDADNQLVEAVRSEGAVRRVARYAYDAFGRRIVKEVAEDGARTETTLFVWDGDVLVQEIRPDRTITYLYEPDSFVPLARIESREGLAGYAADPVHLAHQEQWDLPGGKSDPAEQVRAWRAHEEALLEARHQAFWTKRREIAEPAAAGNDRIHYYHCDHLGTPLELLDESGKPVWAAHYKAWGRIHRQEVREVEQPLRFQGQYEDEETGLFYNRHRYYDPDAARYLTQDPIGLLGGLNGYAYAPNPTGWVDPLGLAKFGTGKGTHTATVSVTDKAGNTQPCGTFHSGNMTPEEKALGFPLSTLATHTEARATNDVPLRPGDTMRIEGQYPPCPSCRGKMNAKAKETGASIIYEWEENGQKKTWRTPKNPCE